MLFTDGIVDLEIAAKNFNSRKKNPVFMILASKLA